VSLDESFSAMKKLTENTNTDCRFYCVSWFGQCISRRTALHTQLMNKLQRLPFHGKFQHQIMMLRYKICRTSALVWQNHATLWLLPLSCSCHSL